MKQTLAIVLLLLSIISNSIQLKASHPYIRVRFIRRIRIGAAPLTLAVLLKKLGSYRSVKRLALDIHRRCGSRRLQRHWLRIIFRYRRVISYSNKFPFTLKRFQYLFNRHRKRVMLLFLRSFIKCGNVRGARRAIKKIITAYVSTKRERKERTQKFIQRIKKIYFRKSKLRSHRDNQTIYPTYLLRKMMRAKRLLLRCIIFKRICRRRDRHCRRARRICRRMRSLRRRINPKVKKTFINYFTSLWAVYIRNPTIRHVKLYVIRRYKRKFQ